MLKKFLEETKAEVEKKMGDGYQIKMEHVLKNNGVELDGILITKDDENIAPSIYLNDYYEEYKCGRTIEAIADEVIEGYFQYAAQKEGFISDLDLSFEKIKDKIYFRLVNLEQNRKMMKSIPYIPFLDLAITFHCLVEKKKGLIGSLHISNELMKEWQIEKADLLKLAMKNTPHLFPASIRTMDEVIDGLLKKDIEELVTYYRRDEVPLETAREAEQCCVELMKHLKRNRKNGMYVISNTSGINGAAALLYENLLKSFSELCHSDFFILPSSIHEILLIPCSSGFSEEELKEMVHEVNQTQVPIEDILSNEVYIYHREGNYFEWEG